MRRFEPPTYRLGEGEPTQNISDLADVPGESLTEDRTGRAGRPSTEGDSAMRRHLLRYIVAAAGALALAAPAQAGPIGEVTSFTGGGVTDDLAIFLRLSDVSLPDTMARVGVVVIGGRGQAPAIGILDCAKFVPNMRGPVAVGGTLYASAIIDDNKRLIRAIDRGPGGGMDEVGNIIDNQPDPGASMCGATDVETSPLMGDFVSGHASA